MVETWGALNMLLAWMLVHQLGYWYRAGIPRAAAVGVLVGGSR